MIVEKSLFVFVRCPFAERGSQHHRQTGTQRKGGYRKHPTKQSIALFSPPIIADWSPHRVPKDVRSCGYIYPFIAPSFLSIDPATGSSFSYPHSYYYYCGKGPTSRLFVRCEPYGRFSHAPARGSSLRGGLSLTLNAVPFTRR